MTKLKRYSTLTKRLEVLEDAQRGKDILIVWAADGVVTLPGGREVPEADFDRQVVRDGLKVVKLTWTGELDEAEPAGL